MVRPILGLKSKHCLGCVSLWMPQEGQLPGGADALGKCLDLTTLGNMKGQLAAASFPRELLLWSP